MDVAQATNRGKRLELVAQLRGHADRVWHVDWNPTGSVLASTSSDCSIRLWGRKGGAQEGKSGADEAPWECQAVLDGVHTRSVRRVVWSPCGKYLASAGFDGLICIWTFDEGEGAWECVAQLEGHENEVKGLAWASSGQVLASSGRDRSVWLWDTEDMEGEFDCLSVLHGHSQDVKNVLWSPLDDVLFSCSYDDSIKQWTEQGDDWYCTDTVKSHKSTVWDMCFDPSGTWLASCSDDLSVGVHQSVVVSAQSEENAVAESKWQSVCNVQNAHQRSVYCIDWVRDSSSNAEGEDENKAQQTGYLVTGGGDDSINMYEFQPPTASQAGSIAVALAVPNAHEADINSVKCNPVDPTLIASGSDDTTVKIWRIVSE